MVSTLENLDSARGGKYHKSEYLDNGKTTCGGERTEKQTVCGRVRWRISIFKRTPSGQGLPPAKYSIFSSFISFKAIFFRFFIEIPRPEVWRVEGTFFGLRGSLWVTRKVLERNRCKKFVSFIDKIDVKRKEGRITGFLMQIFLQKIHIQLDASNISPSLTKLPFSPTTKLTI